jgi:hypothetical protein
VTPIGWSDLIAVRKELRVEDPAKAAAAAAANVELERLKLLFDYTKFHIGVYLTLGGTLVGILNSRVGASVRPGLIWASLGCIAVAGAAGGVIASNIPSFKDATESGFEQAPIGLWGWQTLTGAHWMTVEHLAFWSALLLIALAFAWKRPRESFWKACPPPMAAMARDEVDQESVAGTP